MVLDTFLELDKTKAEVSDEAIPDDQHEEHSSAVGYGERGLVVPV